MEPYSNSDHWCFSLKRMHVKMSSAKCRLSSSCCSMLTHWGQVTHIWVSKLATIGSDNGLSHGRCQSTIWTNAGILLIWDLGTHFSEILSEIDTFLFKKIHLKMSSAKWRQLRLGLSGLILFYICHEPLIRYVKLRVAHAPGMPGTFSLPPRVSNPDMHHGTCVTNVPWCMVGSQTSGFLWSRWRRRRSRPSRRMCNPQLYVSGKRPMATHLVVGFFCHLGDHSILIGLVHTCHVLCHFLYIVLIYSNDRSMKRKYQSAIAVGYPLVQIELCIIPLKMFVSGLAFQDITFNCDVFGRFGEFAIGFPLQRAVDICDV